ncbi:lipopolysaccharide biosynthesis protein [Sphingomonas sp. ST-64]|uniref:Lipopolysaccharide biosynthesis protein n=1 Tax=Sphingomonas plantiphila TaxID=3163295 RepID=A0ABW8YMI7_9SPHN
MTMSLTPDAPERTIEDRGADRSVSLLDRARRHPFILTVLVPTVIVALYLFLIASPQYRSEAQFVVRGLDTQSAPTGGVGQLLGISASLSPGQQEAQSIREYLRSHDAIRALRGDGIDLVALYRKPGTDMLSRLWSTAPRAETLLDFYRDHVDVIYDPDDNITRLSVRAFAPIDAQRITRALLRLGEERVNAYNARLFDASLRLASAEAGRAEEGLASIQRELGGFRERERDIDPAATGAGGTRQIEEQQARLDRLAAMLADMRSKLRGDSPQVRAMETQVATAAASLTAARARQTGQPQAVSGRLGEYEELRLQQDFAAKRYEAARARLEEARTRAADERLYIVAVVEPNLPEKPALPKPFRTTLLVFVGLCVAYGIGWMLIAGVREHQS